MRLGGPGPPGPPAPRPAEKQRSGPRPPEGGPPRREPRPPGPAENQRSSLRPDEGEPPSALDGAVPDLEPELVLELVCERRGIADDPDLGDAEQLGGRERPGGPRLAGSTVR